MAYQVNIAFEESDRLRGMLEGSFEPNTSGYEFLAHIAHGIKIPPNLLAHAPHRFIVPDEQDGHRDFGMVHACWIVTGSFVDLVNALEPNAHEFIQLNSTQASGAPTRRRYYLMNVFKRVSALIADESTVQRRRLKLQGGKEVETIRLNALRQFQKLVVRRKAIEGHHLWRGGPSDLSGALYFSNTLMEQVNAAGLSALDAIRAEEQ